MITPETLLLLIGCVAVMAVLGPQCKRVNTKPPPTYLPKTTATTTCTTNGSAQTKE